MLDRSCQLDSVDYHLEWLQPALHPTCYTCQEKQRGKSDSSAFLISRIAVDLLSRFVQSILPHVLHTFIRLLFPSISWSFLLHPVPSLQQHNRRKGIAGLLAHRVITKQVSMMIRSFHFLPLQLKIAPFPQESNNYSPSYPNPRARYKRRREPLQPLLLSTSSFFHLLPFT